MPKKNKDEETEIVKDNEQFDQPEQIDDSDDIPASLQKIIDECGDDQDYSVSVFHYTNSGQREKVQSYPMSDFRPDDIAKQYGGGKYEYHVRVAGKIKKRLTVIYAKSLIPVETKNTITMEDIRKEFSNKDNSTEKMMEILLAHMQASSQQQLQIMTALLSSKQPVADNSVNKIDEIIKIMQLVGVNNPTNFLNAFEKGLNLSTKIKNNDEDKPDKEDSTTDMILKMVAPLLPAILGKRQAELPPVQTDMPMQEDIDIEKAVVINFFETQKKRILIEFAKKTDSKELAEYLYTGIEFYEETYKAFENKLIKPYDYIFTEIKDFDNELIKNYLNQVIEKIKELLYNADNEDETGDESNDISGNGDSKSSTDSGKN